MSSGRHTARLTFLRRADGNDGRGNPRSDFVDMFSRWADMRMRPGSEVFSAARLEGRVPYSTTIPADPETAQITTGWRARDGQGREYDVQSPAVDPQGRGLLHMMLVMNAGTL